MCSLVQWVQAIKSARERIHSLAQVQPFSKYRGVDLLFTISNWNNSFEILIVHRSDFLLGRIIELHPVYSFSGG